MFLMFWKPLSPLAQLFYILSKVSLMPVAIYSFQISSDSWSFIYSNLRVAIYLFQFPHCIKWLNIGHQLLVELVNLDWICSSNYCEQQNILKMSIFNSIGFPAFVENIFFACSYPSVSHGNTFISSRTFGIIISFRYDSFVTFDLSIFVSNWFQNLKWSVCVPLNCDMNNFRRLPDSYCYFLSYLSCFLKLLFLLHDLFFFPNFSLESLFFFVPLLD